MFAFRLTLKSKSGFTYLEAFDRHYLLGIFVVFYIGSFNVIFHWDLLSWVFVVVCFVYEICNLILMYPGKPVFAALEFK